ncbi:hypothetical protein [Lacipirellula sp.]|uniref:hypothetical protein n=1 Tax=Lacipirellula sp. TaxID=2691419 RepID=UPI003D0F2D7F
MSIDANPLAFRGVSFLTKKGKFKRRYLRQEKLQICGLSEADLDAIIELFCPDRPYYVTTGSGVDDWYDPHRRLKPDEVLRHLLGNILQEIIPKHVAPKCWGCTKFVGIDVDFHPGEEDDFLSRRRLVRKGLRILGVPTEGVLVSDTPSGGKHYRFFLTEAIKLEQIPYVLGKVGIHQKRGRFEIFPCKKTGYRLPFALRPGHEHNPARAGIFIRKFIAGEVPKVNWIECLRRAEAFEAKYGVPREQFQRSHSSSPVSARPASFAKPKLSSVICGVSKQTRLTDASAADDRRIEPSYGSKSVLLMDQLFLTGIAAAGTRTQVTLDLAWHFRFVRRFTASATCDTLLEWVNRTGRETSTTVIEDLRGGTRKADAHTRAIVDWVYRLPEEERAPQMARGRFSRAEVEHLLTKLKYVPANDRLELVEFVLRCLQFAKRHGACDETGWVAEIAAGEVMRSWPRCSGSSYVRKREILAGAGLLQVERGEWRTKSRSGRARTYRLNVERSLSSDATMELEHAVAYASALLSQAGDGDTRSLRLQSENDSKVKVVINNLENHGGVGDRGMGNKAEGQTLKLEHTTRQSFPSTHSLVNSKKAAMESLASEYISLRVGNSSLRTGRVPSSVPVEVQPSQPPAMSSWHTPYLDLPLPPECRDWLLRNSGPGMGIPKRYRLMIEVAQRSVPIKGPLTDHLQAGLPSGSSGSPALPEPTNGVLRDARHGAIVRTGFG